MKNGITCKIKNLSHIPWSMYKYAIYYNGMLIGVVDTFKEAKKILINRIQKESSKEDIIHEVEQICQKKKF